MGGPSLAINREHPALKNSTFLTFFSFCRSFFSPRSGSRSSRLLQTAVHTYILSVINSLRGHPLSSLKRYRSKRDPFHWIFLCSPPFPLQLPCAKRLASKSSSSPTVLYTQNQCAAFYISGGRPAHVIQNKHVVVILSPTLKDFFKYRARICKRLRSRIRFRQPMQPGGPV